jgi:hypothetical protein
MLSIAPKLPGLQVISKKDFGFPPEFAGDLRQNRGGGENPTAPMRGSGSSRAMLKHAEAINSASSRVWTQRIFRDG